MKISLGKFYQEVTGSKTTARHSITTALDRWKIPYDADVGPGADAVDIAYLGAAKVSYSEEVAAGEHAKSEAQRQRYEREKKFEEKLQALAEAVGRIESVVSEIRRRLGP